MSTNLTIKDQGKILSTEKLSTFPWKQASKNCVGMYSYTSTQNWRREKEIKRVLKKGKKEKNINEVFN